MKAEQSVGRGAADRVVCEVNVDWRRPGQRHRSSLNQTMARAHTEIVAHLNSIAPPSDDWDLLQSILDELWTDGRPDAAMPELLALFERYPVDEDGCGVFWSALHGL
ncbi:MAG: hypothetical protein KDA91_26145, partial [Planctomycetaceae bacterium]|nr:hypothetical protein [Planctomycetaceae bacterium]